MADIVQALTTATIAQDQRKRDMAKAKRKAQPSDHLMVMFKASKRKKKETYGGHY